ncbi:MAG: hypothetical protein IPL20_03040 [Saprospiraceae bacterium]|nr:hypothetical protein [Saprospiraceae bacterium]
MYISHHTNIPQINRRHFLETDLYYRVSYGMSSTLLKYENGIFFLELTLSKECDKNYNAAAAEMAYCWKSRNPELDKALGCKVFIIDLRGTKLKSVLINSGVTHDYNACKGILFRNDYLN